MTNSLLTHVLFVCAFSLTMLASAAEPKEIELLDYHITVETILKHDDGNFLWFHPRAAPVPGQEPGDSPAVILTLQKHLRTSDHYSGLSVMRTDDLGKSWTKPDPRPELDWTHKEGVDIAVADVTPGWHRQTGKLIAIGAQVRYSKQGEQLEDVRRAHQTAYAVLDPQTGRWTRWRRLAMPAGVQFNFARSACAQFLVEADGSLLLPFYIGPNARDPHSITVVRCTFDGTTLSYAAHGNIMSLDLVRGLVEPSLVRFQQRYYLTVRNDVRGYVTHGVDGLNFKPIQAWKFDDGQELGSYNTQQHWLSHSDGLFLVYTRRGANNDHIFRHRAPLFIAQVDPRALLVIRSTERVLLPERGATLGNFGATAVNEHESWVTAAEYVANDEARKRGAEGAVFVARVIWGKPNKQATGN